MIIDEEKLSLTRIHGAGIGLLSPMPVLPLPQMIVIVVVP